MKLNRFIFLISFNLVFLVVDHLVVVEYLVFIDFDYFVLVVHY